MCAVFKFPGARQAKDIAPIEFLDQAQVLFACEAGVGDHDHLLTPGQRLKAAQHLAKQYVLTPFDFGIDQLASDGDAEPTPLRDEQHQIHAENVGGELVHPRLVRQRRFLPTFLLGGLVGDQIEPATGWRRQGQQGCHRHLIEQC
jgi:hypothetical protein